MHFILVIVSLVALVWAANHLISGATGIASYYHMPAFITGFTLIGLSTSAPELTFSLITAFKDSNELTIGNAIGSNIANISLVLGVTLMLKPDVFNSTALKRAYPILMIVMLFTYSLILDGFLSPVDGCLFLIVCLLAIAFFIYVGGHIPKPKQFFVYSKTSPLTQCLLFRCVISFFLGLIVLTVSAKYIVYSAIHFAEWAGVSPITTSLTIMAFGTTLPELVTALIAAFKGEEELAIGTILGSNIYNLLLVFAFPALVNPNKVSSVILWKGMPVLIGLTILLFFFNYYYKKRITSWHGGVLILIYCCYILSLFIKGHF